MIRAAIPASAPISNLAAQLGDAPLAHLFLFVSPTCDFARVVAEARAAFPGCRTVACTTAGEIGPEGYVDDTIIAVGLPARHFATDVVVAQPLDGLARADLAGEVVRRRLSLSGGAPPHFVSLFGFALVDGLSRAEDVLLSEIAPGLGHMPLFGGSAGDGRRFESTLLGCDGHVYDNAAVVTLIATDCRVQVFSLDHMTPTERRMVVTGADPATRTVREINGAPAAREYARLMGRDPEQLDTFTFAAHPVVVRLGEDHHVRAIQRVTEAGDLVFFSAIEEGMVLSVATPGDMTAHLEGELSTLSATGAPADILACDCILRRIEAEHLQQGRAVSEVLARHRVVGFSTYGEQIGPIHINHTMTGVALYPPADGNGGDAP